MINVQKLRYRSERDASGLEQPGHELLLTLRAVYHQIWMTCAVKTNHATFRKTADLVVFAARSAERPRPNKLGKKRSALVPLRFVMQDHSNQHRDEKKGRLRQSK